MSADAQPEATENGAAAPESVSAAASDSLSAAAASPEGLAQALAEIKGSREEAAALLRATLAMLQPPPAVPGESNKRLRADAITEAPDVPDDLLSETNPAGSTEDDAIKCTITFTLTALEENAVSSSIAYFVEEASGCTLTTRSLGGTSNLSEIDVESTLAEVPAVWYMLGTALACEARMLVNNDAVSRIIGKQGVTIKQIQAQSGAELAIQTAAEMSTEQLRGRQVTIRGDPKLAARAIYLILRLLTSDPTFLVLPDACPLAPPPAPAAYPAPHGSLAPPPPPGSEAAAQALVFFLTFLSASALGEVGSRRRALSASQAYAAAYSMAAAAYVQQPQYAYADPSQPQLQQQVAPYPAGPVQTPVPAAQAPTAQAFYDEATQTWVQPFSAGGAAPMAAGGPHSELKYHSDGSSRFYVPNEAVKSLIGKQGKNVADLEMSSGARIGFAVADGTQTREVTLKGSEPQKTAAYQAIWDRLRNLGHQPF